MKSIANRSKDKILSNIREANKKRVDLPILEGLGVDFDDKIAHFADTLASVGGELIDSPEDINTIVKRLYPDVKKIATTEIGLIEGAIDPNKLEDPHLLDGIELAIVKAEFGVAENGAVWVQNPLDRHKALYFIAKHILFILDREKIVSSMHEAYKMIEFNDSRFGVFISGPSKTADIEQSLVIGAHGAISSRVLLV